MTAERAIQLLSTLEQHITGFGADMSTAVREQVYREVYATLTSANPSDNYTRTLVAAGISRASEFLSAHTRGTR
jgi:hypothetical protein